MDMDSRAGFIFWQCGLLLFCCGIRAAEASAPFKTSGTFRVQGVVQELKPDRSTVVIRHEAIPDYMKAMTMPFRAQTPGELAGLRPGDAISFSLHVDEVESWIDGISNAVASVSENSLGSDGSAAAEPPGSSANHPLLDYKFTNELGQKVSLSEFKGQALAITFFFTRCPIPDYCPRLSKNFQEASRKLGSRADGPTNWHFLSVTFDPQFDTAPVLKAYAKTYQYDAAHWSFLTGPNDKIAELARLSDVKFDAEGGLFNHNFRTLIIDAAGRLQMTFPIGGNLSDAIVEEILKACAASNLPPVQASADSPNADVR